MGLELDSELKKNMSCIFLLYKNLGNFFSNHSCVWNRDEQKVFSLKYESKDQCGPSVSMPNLNSRELKSCTASENLCSKTDWRRISSQNKGLIHNLTGWPSGLRHPAIIQLLQSSQRFESRQLQFRIISFFGLFWELCDLQGPVLLVLICGYYFLTRLKKCGHYQGAAFI